MKQFFRGLCTAVLALAMLVSTASALTVEQALELLEENYIRQLPPEAYEAATLEELFGLLGDPYTDYLTEEEYRAFLDSMENTVNVVGIGVSVQFTDEGILVVDVLNGGSALQAGLKPGDLIVRVNGVSCVPAAESHRELLTGEVGSWVSVELMRNGVRHGYALERQDIVITNTEFTRKGNVGYIDCTSFGSETGDLFLKGVETYNEAVDSWLVDVRSNGGGYAQAAVAVLGVFAGPGPQLYLQDSQGRLYYYEYYDVDATDHPLVVLVNGGTASAAEAFAAGVRDLGLGITVGSRTYGKGVAQIVLDRESLPGYFEGDALKVTAYRFYSAAGLTNDGMGVIPTLLVPDEMAEAVARALCPSADADREDLLRLIVGDWELTVDTANTEPEVLSALYDALPPGTHVWASVDGVEFAVTLEEARTYLGYDIPLGGRWFSDVADSPYAYEVNSLATYQIIHGDGEGNFFPGETLKRGEACAMLAKALGLTGTGRQHFDDVPVDHPFAAHIGAMAELGLVQGPGDGLFCPEETLTQAEYFTLLARVACYLDVDLYYTALYPDAALMERAAAQGFPAWAQNGAVLLDLVDAQSVRAVVPGRAILRDEAAASLYQVLATSGFLPE